VFEVENRSGILVVLSHLIADAWTFGLMANQVDAAYHRLAGDTENAEDISLLKSDYADYIRSEIDYMASERYVKDRKYWEEKYTDCPRKSLIKMQSVSTSSILAKRVTRTLPLSLEQRMDGFCRTNSVTPAVLFETALVIYLYKINSENSSITIGVPVLNRCNAREKEIAGMFVSTMPLTVTLSEDTTVVELAKQITREHMNIFRHQKYPYGNILRFLREKHMISGNLYNVMVSYQNAKTDTQANTKWYSNGYSEIPFVLHIDNRDGNSSHTLNVDYQTEIFQEEEVDYIIKRLEYILEQLTGNRAGVIKDVDIVPKQEWKKVVCEFNDTRVEYPRDKCVHELFSEQVEKTPDNIALVFEDKTFTYRQLDEMSNSLAYFLREKGVKRNDVVPIIAKRSWHVIVAMLGIMKAGGAYMPISLDYPESRLKYILFEARAKIVLLYRFTFVQDYIESVNLETINYYNKIGSISNRNYIDDYCYIIYTSGSTGTPKGICQTHRCMSNLVLWQMTCGGSDKSNILASTIMTFDVSVQEIMYSLINGKCLFLTEENVKNNIALYADFINRNKINELFVTPSYFNLICKLHSIENIPSLKNIYFSGEKFNIDRKVLKKLIESKVIIWNQYGPAETHVATCKRINDVLDATIGKPISNMQIYILDKNQKILPIGVSGELCIAGNGVGKGYLNRSELTAERFVPNPFSTKENHHGKVLYHTGDYARWRVDGEIEYLGRIDTQVKIRGLRIELEEIESVMGALEGIELTSVTDKLDENGRQYLVGYYTAKEEIEEKKIREHLAEKLPGYMTPNYFMHLDNMPMTPSGKIDRKKLPTPNYTARKNDYIAPTTDTEKKLADIWKRLLYVEVIGKIDDFYELGGDSLLAISMLNELRTEFAVEISIKDILGHSVLEQLALCIDQAPQIRQMETFHDEKYMLLPQQKAIYAVYRKNPNTLTYNMPARIHLPENIDKSRLKQSINHVLECHKILKSHICMVEDDIYGIYDENIHISFEEYKNENEATFIRPFLLEKESLVRVGFTEDSLLFDMHHIIADGNSLNIILRDIIDAYEGKSIRKSEVEYSDYSRYFYKLDFSEHKKYFAEMLKCDFEPVLFLKQKMQDREDCQKYIIYLRRFFRKQRRMPKKTV